MMGCGYVGQKTAITCTDQDVGEAWEACGKELSNAERLN